MWRFVITFTTDATESQYKPDEFSHILATCFFKFRVAVILPKTRSCTPSLSSGSFSKIWKKLVFCPLCPTCPAIVIYFELISLIIFAVEHAPWRRSVCSLHCFLQSLPTGKVQLFASTSCSRASLLCFRFFFFLRERPRFTPIKEKRHITPLRNIIFICIGRKRDFGICKTRKPLWDLGDHGKPYVEFHAVQFSIKNCKSLRTHSQCRKILQKKLDCLPIFTFFLNRVFGAFGLV